MKDSNKRPWLILLACCGLACASIGISMNAAGVFYDAVCQELGFLRSSYSLHMTIFTLVTAATALWVTKIYHMLPVKLVLWVSVLIACASTATMALCTTLPAFYITAAVRGASCCLFSTVLLTMVINRWFLEKSGLATSICFAFTGLGGALFSPVFSAVISAAGWRMGYLVMAVLVFVFCIPALFFPFALSPRRMGAQPYGQKFENKLAGRQDVHLPRKVYGRLLVVMFLFGIFTSAITSIGQYFPGYAASIGFSASVGAALLSLAMVGNVASKLLIGILSDKIGAVRSVLVMIGACVCGLFLIMSGWSSLAMMAGALLFGGCYSVAAVGVSLLTMHFFGLQDYMKAFPLVSVGGNVGAASALPLIGLVFDLSGSYTLAFLLCFGFLIIYTGCLFGAMRIRSRADLSVQTSLQET